MRFDILEAELSGEIAGYVFPVEIFPAGVDVNAHEFPVRERVNADVRFHDDNKTAPAAGVFDAVVVGFVHLGFSKNIHADFFGKFFEAFLNQLFVIEFFEIPAITVQRQMFSKITGFFIFSFKYCT